MNADLTRAVQWYPGHMVRAMRALGRSIRLTDLVIEAIDARAPSSGANPALDDLARSRDRITVLTRDDLADPRATRAWLDALGSSGREVLAIDARSHAGIARLRASLARRSRTHDGILRVMVVGIPNSGKSTLVNALLGRAAARTENRAGVTRAPQWFRLSSGVELLDTPGILVPKIAGARAQWILAAIGAVPAERYDAEEIVARLVAWGRTRGADVPTLEEFARERGFVRRGGELDAHNAARAYLAAFARGTFGRYTLEEPSDAS
jgi:ribosome biogenesis GTPase A